MNMELLLNSTIGVRKPAVTEVLACNEITAQYGLALTQSEAQELVETHAQALHNHGRIEFTHGTIRKIIMAFCDSPFLFKSNYAETLSDLVDTFYYFKNETLDELSDDELLRYMKAYFDKNCQGSMELLQNRELDALARAIRFGYKPGNDVHTGNGEPLW